MIAIVWSSISSAIASTSASVVFGSTGAMRSSIPNRWQALSKAAWPVSGFTKLGRVTPRVSRGVLAVGEHGVQDPAGPARGDQAGRLAVA